MLNTVSFDQRQRFLLPYSSAQRTQNKRDLCYQGISNWAIKMKMKMKMKRQEKKMKFNAVRSPEGEIRFLLPRTMLAKGLRSQWDILWFFIAGLFKHSRVRCVFGHKWAATGMGTTPLSSHVKDKNMSKKIWFFNKKANPSMKIHVG